MHRGMSATVIVGFRSVHVAVHLMDIKRDDNFQFKHEDPSAIGSRFPIKFPHRRLFISPSASTGSECVLPRLQIRGVGRTEALRMRRGLHVVELISSAGLMLERWSIPRFKIRARCVASTPERTSDLGEGGYGTGGVVAKALRDVEKFGLVDKTRASALWRIFTFSFGDRRVTVYALKSEICLGFNGNLDTMFLPEDAVSRCSGIREDEGTREGVD
ncbi:hypothetical protein R3P38DRAFT_3361867 [Favolaschia claudopus]|uniref:Uncharacterized protein n=1 Tax=Favolaschia claudopus TaxID=2862362 RepID=A0AAW0ARJ3_9AGAR